MLAGHFTTALIANQKYPKGTLLFFLIASQLQDLLWLCFHYLGLEPTNPSDVFNASLSNMAVDMLYSHDLLPQIIWLVIIFIVGKILFKSTQIGLAGSALVLGHFILDLFSGHAHHIFGADTADVALGLYATNVYLALTIEAVFIVVALWFFFKQDIKNGVERSTKNKAQIIGLFIFGVVFMFSIAKFSFREMLGIPEFDLGFNTNVPNLIFTYGAMIAYLYYFVPKFEKNNK